MGRMNRMDTRCRDRTNRMRSQPQRGIAPGSGIHWKTSPEGAGQSLDGMRADVATRFTRRRGGAECPGAPARIVGSEWFTGRPAWTCARALWLGIPGD